MTLNEPQIFLHLKQKSLRQPLVVILVLPSKRKFYSQSGSHPLKPSREYVRKETMGKGTNFAQLFF